MKKLLPIFIFLLLTIPSLAAQNLPSCATGGVQLATGLSVATFTDNTVIDNTIYGYIVAASNNFGTTCSIPFTNVSIPTTGTHTVTLTWNLVSGVTYAVFRGTSPTAPVVTVVVN